MRNYQSKNQPPQRASITINPTVINNSPSKFARYIPPSYNIPQNFTPYINSILYTNPQNMLYMFFRI